MAASRKRRQRSRRKFNVGKLLPLKTSDSQPEVWLRGVLSKWALRKPCGAKVSSARSPGRQPRGAAEHFRCRWKQRSSLWKGKEGREREVGFGDGDDRRVDGTLRWDGWKDAGCRCQLPAPAAHRADSPRLVGGIRVHLHSDAGPPGSRPAQCSMNERSGRSGWIWGDLYAYVDLCCIFSPSPTIGTFVDL